MQKTHQCQAYCPCPAACDARNTRGGGSGRPDQVPAPKYPALAVARLMVDLFAADLEARIAQDLATPIRRSVWAEIRMGTTEACVRFALAHPRTAEVLEGAATGLLLMLPTAAIMACLYGPASR